ncbi:MAG TPA: phosphoribosylaminoimidazolesuccinocarboxamide synthase [Syntrophales bacterium]|nr:phosphoribosylaminoimidazolesuccinocarboxamide synthase [Syntrophales bacterium]
MADSDLIKTNFLKLNLVNTGKVRDLYEVGPYLLIVATDRISAFDVVMQEPIPGKGKILTQMSIFWFKKLEHLIGHHLISTNPADYPPECRPYIQDLEGRSMLVKKAKPLPVECIVRGYLSGSGWKDYCMDRTISGIRLPEGLKESSRLPEPIFTPTTKAPEGQHDAPISRKEVEDILGKEITGTIIEKSMAIYKEAAAIADKAGIIIADTKFEFGLLGSEVILIDEVLTPDSSRFWPKDDYEEGRSQKSFDKQFLRDYLLSLSWDQQPPAPRLPQDIIEKTREKYEEALKRLTQ